MPPPRIPLLLLPLLLAVGAQAVVHVTGDGSGNTTAPTDDPGFANVGVSDNSLTGVYLGDRWVLSAHHVGEQGFTFAGTPYPAVPGSRVALETSPGVIADLELVRIVGTPPLPAPVLSSGSPQVGETVTMIGNGRDREATLTCWNSSWDEISCPPPGPAAAYEGYTLLGSRTLRWGRNVVTATGVTWVLANRTSIAFETAFDPSGVADEAQAVTGDSGGAVFAKRGAQWELVGVMFAATGFPDQPTNVAVFGQESLLVDLHPYLDQIDAIMNPPEVIPAVPAVGLLLAAAGMLGATRRSLRLRRR